MGKELDEAVVITEPLIVETKFLQRLGGPKDFYVLITLFTRFILSWNRRNAQNWYTDHESDGSLFVCQVVLELDMLKSIIFYSTFS